MAQIETSGGGISYTSDGKKLTKQVYVLTAGETSVTPTPIAGATITSADFVQSEGGTTRVTITWTKGLDPISGGSSSGSAGAGATTELIGGSREIPTEAHPKFKDSVTDSQLEEIKRAIAANQDPDTNIVPNTESNKARILYKLLLRGQEYYLAPAVSYRQTTLETTIPALRELCTINAPQRTPAVASNQNWLLTSINVRSVALPTETVAYEVTKEWMLSDRNGWSKEIYDGT